MELYKKVETNGDITFEHVEPKPTAQALKIAADYRYLLATCGNAQSGDVVAMLKLIGVYDSACYSDVES